MKVFSVLKSYPYETSFVIGVFCSAVDAFQGMKADMAGERTELSRFKHSARARQECWESPGLIYEIEGWEME